MKKKVFFGGNSGYQGYSMSNRALEVYDNGKIPYIKLPMWAKNMVNTGIATTDEWHHTSVYGNKTPFYHIDQFKENLTENNIKELENNNVDINQIIDFNNVPKKFISYINKIAEKLFNENKEKSINILENIKNLFSVINEEELNVNQVNEDNQTYETDLNNEEQDDEEEEENLPRL